MDASVFRDKENEPGDGDLAAASASTSATEPDWRISKS